MKTIFNSIKTPLLFCAIQIMSYALLTLNFRAIAEKNLLVALITDGLNCTLSFFFFRKMLKEKDENSIMNWFGYFVGGLIGTTIGMLI